MRFQTNYIYAVLLATAIGVAGCASPRHDATPAGVPYTGVPVSLHPAPGLRAVHASLDRSSLAYMNARRAEVGLPPISPDRDVAAAAAAHASYLRLNSARGHDEMVGAQGFTGVDVTARVRVHTPTYGASEVQAVFGGVQQPASAVAEIYASPFHRGVVLFDWARAGEAVDGVNAGITVVDFADIAPVLTDAELIAYPYDGQADAPASWIDEEQPDPMGAASGYVGALVGYPITLSGSPNAHIDLKALELTDARGKRVACRIAPLSPADAGRNTAVCTPFVPLEAGALYAVHATGFLTRSATAERAPFELRWHFATAPASDDAPRHNYLAAR
ncbi:CAP domain-containing protein [Paraburkholderia domus]|uniref:CAP domain-containing protein n=1 Tax=Paraburkholderia domus TaxID=2793075 RepID=UPI001911E35E|nr:CAP domain-containing protein [Paraburkholderia domus]MBK5065988.1 CAP domain-containing protein [Burkholderia sp. R-70199]CAE6965116.1 hypothetical protein R70199_07629 [Paraburkholderia domus]